MLKSKNEVRIIIFVTNEIEDRYAKIPANYLSKSKELPFALVDEIKRNGWVDKSGNVWWRKDFEPKPVKAKDGNVYLALSDADIEDEARHIRRLNSALEMLNL
jgi:hypothetical protein